MELLNDMALFVEVVKARSFRRAGEVMGIPTSTMSRRISGLEKAIGLRLLHRTTRKIELTEAGQIYFDRCKRIVDEARLAHEQLDGMLEQPAGVLRASLPVDFANIFLIPVLAEFAEQYPAIRFELDVTPRRVDLVTEPFDVAIRIGEPPSSSLIARPIARLPQALFASPRYLAKAGNPEQPQDLVDHECVCFYAGWGSRWELRRQEDIVNVEVSGRFKVNSVGMLQRLARHDQGITLIAAPLAAEDVANGKLQRVLPEWDAPPVPVYAITETRLLPAKTQRFIEFLRDRLSTAG